VQAAWHLENISLVVGVLGVAFFMPIFRHRERG
jgi:hypothetical protein